MLCSKCGHPISNGDKYCSVCGNAINPQVEVPSDVQTTRQDPKKRSVLFPTVAIVLAVMLAGGTLVFLFSRTGLLNFKTTKTVYVRTERKSYFYLDSEGTPSLNRHTVYEHDSLGQLMGISNVMKDGDAQKLAQFSTDAAGLRTALIFFDDEGNRVTFDVKCDACGCITEITGSGAEYISISYAYDENHRIASEMYSSTDSNMKIEYTYDKKGNMLTMDYKSDEDEVRFAYQYDAKGRLTGAKRIVEDSRGDHVYTGVVDSQDKDGATEIKFYDSDQNLTSIEKLDAAGNMIETRSYIGNYGTTSYRGYISDVYTYEAIEIPADQHLANSYSFF